MIARFRQVYADPAGALAQASRPVLTLGYDAPRARLIAAGFQPVRLVAPLLSSTPRADTILGAAEMGPRGRRLLEALTDAAIRDVPVLITQADADQPQLFAALRELGRLGEPVPANVHFCDLLHSVRPATLAYNVARLAQLDAWLMTLGGRAPVAHLAEAEALLAAQRTALDRLAEARRARRISGADVLRVHGALASMAPSEGLAALDTLLAELANASELSGTPTIVCGSAHEGDELYATIEQGGALIVGETHPWGDAPRIPPRVIAASDEAARAAALVAASGATSVLHLTIDGDETAPWSAGAVERALPQGVSFRALRTRREGLPEPQPPKEARPAAAKPRPAPPARSRKALASTAEFNSWQRNWFAGLRQEVADGAPFAVVNANAPQEILRAMDVPFVVNQWWAAIVAAKQQSRHYQGLLRDHGYPADVEAYSAQGLAAAFDEDADNAPWGGLPKPDFLHAVASSDPTLRIFDAWAAESGAQPFVYERTVDPRPDLYADWWARLPGDWQTAVEAERVDLMVAEMRAVIAEIEARTDRRFSPERLRAVMDLVNEQEDYYRKTRDLVARTVPAPIGVVDSMPATMVPQWQRGTAWGRDAAKAFYEEVLARAEAWLGACENERVRLMWVGRGLWSEMGFYQKWEESHGAVFVWSMYLALAADGYIREIGEGDDPLRALASRVVCMGDELRMPTWAGPWHVHEAETHQVDGAVALKDADPFVVRALRAAGIPVLELTADNFNREGEDAAGIEAAITAFIEGPAARRAEARRVRA